MTSKLANNKVVFFQILRKLQICFNQLKWIDILTETVVEEANALSADWLGTDDFSNDVWLWEFF